jgi:hypothetical protein
MVIGLNKIGIIRIVEASIAILIIFSAVLIISSRTSVSEEASFADLGGDLLEEIAKDNGLREKIISNPSEGKKLAKSFVGEKIKSPDLNFEINVCLPEEICSLEKFPEGVKEVFSSERIISSTIRNFNPKKIKIFLWTEG